MLLSSGATAIELLERDQQLTQLEEHRRLAAAGQGRLVLIGGEAGVGKTALVEEFCRRLSGPSPLRMSCDALSTPSPLGPARDLAPLLGLHVDHFPVDRPERDQLFHAVFAAFAARTEPTVAVGEDAHWADGVSLEFVRFLARRIADLPILFIVTYRDDEIGLSHPLRLLLGDLATSPTVHRLGVSPLTEMAVDQLAAPTGRATSHLYRLTGGNPFFLSEVLAAEGDAVPASVGDAILARAARLSPEARTALDVAAAIGSSVGKHDLALLAHHAEAAGDRAAVMEYAFPAATQAAALHAHREAAKLSAPGLPITTFEGVRLGLSVDSGSPDGWGSYTANHVYERRVIGKGTALSLRFTDPVTSDNAGGLTVVVFCARSPRHGRLARQPPRVNG